MIKVNEKFEKALELQEQGIPRDKIWKLLEYKSVDPLTKMYRRRGYKYDDSIGKYVLQEIDKSNTVVKVEAVQTVEFVSIDTSIQEKIVRLADQCEELENIIEWFKTKDNMSNTEVIQVVQGLQIELPTSENIMISTRSNKEVWERFNRFCEEFNQFKKGDLLAKALIDMIDTYGNKK